MPEFYSLERPPKEKTDELLEKLYEYREAKPRLTFPFNLSERRKLILEMIKAEEIEGNEVLEFLKSDDFVEKNAAVYLLRKTKIPEDKVNEILTFLEKLSEDENWFIRKTAVETRAKIIAKNKDDKALSFLEKMSEDENSLVREAAVKVLGGFGEKALPLLEKMSEDSDDIVREVVAKALENFGEKVLPILKKMIKDENWFVHRAAAETYVKIIARNKNDRALLLLEKMSKNRDKFIREAVAEFLGNFDDKALFLLEQLSEDKIGIVREAVARALGNFGEKALPLLEKMSKDTDNFVREAVAKTLGNFGEKALPLLKRMSEDNDQFVRELALQSIRKIKYKDDNEPYLYLLSTQKPLFATYETEELMERIKKLQKITTKLKEKFNDKFIGLVIFGSTAKGYFIKQSDLDWGIVAKEKSVSKAFQEMAEAESFNLCHEYYVGVNERNKISGDFEILFYGLFFGDFDKLSKLQENVLLNIGEKEWDKVREVIMENETALFKASMRFGIEEEKVEEIAQFASLLRVPPPYQETLKIVRERAKNKK